MTPPRRPARTSTTPPPPPWWGCRHVKPTRVGCPECDPAIALVGRPLVREALRAARAEIERLKAALDAKENPK